MIKLILFPIFSLPLSGPEYLCSTFYQCVEDYADFNDDNNYDDDHNGDDNDDDYNDPVRVAGGGVAGGDTIV